MGRRRRPSWYTDDDARADRAARYGGSTTPSTQPGGVLAQFDGFCWGCDRTIVRNESRVVPRKGSWVCVSCAGVDDE